MKRFLLHTHLQDCCGSECLQERDCGTLTTEIRVRNQGEVQEAVALTAAALLLRLRSCS